MALPERKELMAREVAHAAGRYVVLNSNRQSLITVTRADIAPDFSKATIFVSVLPEDQEKPALAFLKRSRGDFRNWVADEMNLKRLPTFDFEIDFGEKNRLKVQNL
jgi:ribosome-binding factor A